MNRKNIYSVESGSRTLIGWFDADRAKEYPEGVREDESDQISPATDSQWQHETLWITAQGRHYILGHYNGDGEAYEYITPLTAYQWLVRNGYAESVINDAMNGASQRKGVPSGRPAIGPQIKVRLPEELLARVDRAAEADGLTRSAWIRRALESVTE